MQSCFLRLLPLEKSDLPRGLGLPCPVLEPPSLSFVDDMTKKPPALPEQLFLRMDVVPKPRAGSLNHCSVYTHFLDEPM